MKVCIGCGRLMRFMKMMNQPRGESWACDWDDCPVVIHEYRHTDGELDYVKLGRKQWIQTPNGLLLVARERKEG